MNDGRLMRFAREWWPVVSLGLALVLIVAVVGQLGGDQTRVTLTEMLIRMVVVIAT
jgi:hypothetical protein